MNGHLASAQQSSAITTTFYVGANGAVYRRYVSGAAGAWQGPIAVTATNFAPGGAPMPLAKLTANQLFAFFVGNNGAVYYSTETNDGP